MTTNSIIKCASYGSLRKPMYNYIRFLTAYGEKSFNYLSTTRIYGWKLYKVTGDYPGIVPAKSNFGITVDLFDVSPACYGRVHNMEVGAGYYEDDITFGNTTFKIFPYAGDVIEDNLIATGDFVAYMESIERFENKLKQITNVN